MLQEGTFASADYLAKFGTPCQPEDLENHRMIGFVSSVTGYVMPLELMIDGKLEYFTPPLALSVAAGESMVAAAEAGLGLIQLPRYHAAHCELIEVLADYRPSLTPVSLLYPHNRQLSPRVRVFIDWVTKEFGK